MAAGNPCYSGDSGIPLLPSSTNPAGNQYVRSRQGDTPPPAPVNPGANIRLTVGNCYEADVPIVNNTPDASGSPRVSIPRPPTIDDSTPLPAATAADTIRAVVDNCYNDDDGPALTPDNQIPGQNPRRRIGEQDPEPEMSPGDLVRQIVQNCYGPDDISLTPRPPGPPRPRQGEPDPEPKINPGQVIRDIVDRCYPVVPVPDITPDEFPGVDPIIEFDPVGPTDWLCELFPDLAICNIFPIGPFPFPDGDGPVPGGDDCKRVMAGLADETVAISPIPDEADQGIFYVLDTGEKLLCPGKGRGTDDPGDDGDWDKCVKEAVECIFKPYITGTWKTPGADCSTFYFRGQNSTTGEICVKYCAGARVPIYEYTSGAGARNVMLSPISNGINGSGSFLKHNLRVITTDVAGNYNGGKVFCEAGNKYFNSSSIQTRTVSLGGASVTFKCRGVLDGNEYDSEWWIDSWSGTLPATGTTTTHTWNAGKNDLTVELEVTGPGANDHRYGLSSTPDPGYNLVSDEPAFYILEAPGEGAVPLYRFYSSSVQDTLLTVNPGKPDGPGEGIRAYIDDNGYTQGNLLGYAFTDPSKAMNYLYNDEEVQELHGYVRRGEPEEVSAEFNGSNQLVVSGTGSIKLKVEVKWDDSASSDGRPFETLSMAGFSVQRSGEKGSGSGYITVTGGQTYSISGINYSTTRKNNNRTLCLGDSNSSCNAQINLGDIQRSGGLGTATDHKYSTVLYANPQKPLRYDPSRLAYRIATKPVSPIVISYNVIKGNAGYENSWGVAITNKNGDQIYWARVIEANTTRDIETTQYKIPLDVLLQYPNKYIVFFLIPDGNGGVSSGQSISFNSQSPQGYKHSASTENGWVFFSYRKMNPTEDQGSASTSKVRFNGNNWQWWEDLLDGDDDYDDFKIYYEMMQPGGDYKYEGIECYVFDNPSPPKVMIPIIVKEQCSNPNFDGIFADVTMTRAGCGRPVPENEMDKFKNSNIGKCDGEYLTEINKTQTIKAYKSGSFALKAFGSFINAPESQDIKFRYKLQKNNVDIVNKKLDVGDWPNVGVDLATFNVAEGDELKFVIQGPIRGPAYGNASLGFILMDTNDDKFEKPWNVNLITAGGAGEGAGRSNTYGTGRTSSQNTSSPDTDQGRIKKLKIALWDHREEKWTDPVTVWNNGQVNTNGGNGQSADWDDIYYGGDDWAEFSPQNSHPGFYEGGTADRWGHIMSTQHDARGQWNNVYTYNNPRGRVRGIFYNTLFEHGRGLICRPAQEVDKLKRNYYHLSNSHGFNAWFAQYRSVSYGYEASLFSDIDDYYAKGINQGNPASHPKGTAITSGGQYSKMSFMHDYVMGEYGNKERAIENSNLGKIRMAFWPYSIPDQSWSGGSRYGSNIYWGCAVEVFDIIDRGEAYQVGQEFELVWPPEQPKKPKYQNSNGSVTPYFPRDAGANVPLPKEIDVTTIGMSDRTARRYSEDRYTPREVFYQESHNRDSNIWYMCQTGGKVDRVKFKIIIDEVE